MDARTTTYPPTSEQRVDLSLTIDEAAAVCQELFGRVPLSDSPALGALYRALHGATHPGMAP